MKGSIRLIAIVLLLTNSISALYGGGQLMADPSGASIGLPLHWLDHSPFHTYFLPGFILLVVNGLFSLIAAILCSMDYRFHPQLIILQGLVLLGWLVIQVMLIQTVSVMHWIMGMVAVALLFSGGAMIYNQYKDELRKWA